MTGLGYAAAAAAIVVLSACGNSGAGNAVKAGESTSNAANAAAPAKAASNPAAQQKPKDDRQAEANKDRRERPARGVPRDQGDYDMPIDTYEPQDSEEEGSTDMPVDTYEPQG